MIFVLIANFIAVVLLIAGIYNSQRRWLAFGYASLGFFIAVVLGYLILIGLAGSGVLDHSGVAQTNRVIDAIANVIQFTAPFAAAYGASIPPQRKA
jgi:hypothetical protein